MQSKKKKTVLLFELARIILKNFTLKNTLGHPSCANLVENGILLEHLLTAEVAPLLGTKDL